MSLRKNSDVGVECQPRYSAYGSGREVSLGVLSRRSEFRKHVIKDILMTHPYRLLLLFVVILALRLGVAILIDTRFEVSKGAEEVYASIAKNLVQGNGFVAEPGEEPILHRAPLYPLFLAGVYATFGTTDSFTILCAQAILDGGSGLLLWWIGAPLFGRTIAAIAALLYAVYPLSAYYTLRMLPESIFTLVLLSVIASLMWAISSNRAERFLLVGAWGAIAALVKPVAVGLIPFLAFLLLVRMRHPLSAAVVQIGCLLVTFVLVLTPWTLRNYLVTGHLVPVATGGGRSLWVGNNLISDGRDNDEIEGATLDEFLRRYEAISAPFRKDDSMTDRISLNGRNRPVNIGYEEDRAFTLAALDEVQAHPLETLGLQFRKFFRFWFSIYTLQNRWAQIYIYGLQGTLLLFALYGILRARQAKLALFPVLAVCAYLPLVYTLILSTLRYSMPLVPVLMLFAAVGAGDIVSRLARRLNFPLPSISWAE